MRLIWVTCFIATCLVQEVYSVCAIYSQQDGEETEYYYFDAKFDNLTMLCRNISSLEDVVITTHNFPKMANLTKLKISESVISIIPPSWFQQFIGLSKLELISAKIKSISPGAFDQLEKLEFLNINSNLFGHLDDGVFKGLHNLKVLQLSNNQIDKISKSAFLGLDSLTSLNLSSNRLVNFDSSLLPKSQILQILDVSRNPLEEIYISEAYENFDLYVSETSLKQENFNFQIKYFHSLDWSHSHLSEINILSLPLVENIDLSHNEIKSIENLAAIQSKKINLQHNKLTMIDEKLFGYQNFHKPSQLLVLDLSFNEMLEINKYSFQNLSSLEYLFLNNNNITKIEPLLFKSLEGLEFLNLSSNSIKKFQFGTFDHVSKLKILDLSHNNLTDSHEWTFHSLHELEVLYLHDNQITFLEIRDLKHNAKNLKKISLDSNNFTCQNLVRLSKVTKYLDVEVLKGNTFDVENYHGIPCIDDNKIELDSSENALQKVINDRVVNSELVHFFNSGYKNSNLIQHIDKDYSSDNLSRSTTTGDHVLIINSILQIVVSVFILVVIVYGFMYFKKFVAFRELGLSSQMELCDS